MGDLGILAQLATVIVLSLTLWSSIRLLDSNTRPQVECYLRPRPNEPFVIEMVIANFGKGGARKLEVELIGVDEDDFEAHDVIMKWRKKGPIAFLGPQESLADMFGVAPSLMGDKASPMKPFRVRASHKWTPFWSWRHHEEVDYYEMDLRPFQGIIPAWPENEVAKALKNELPKITKAVGSIRRPPLPTNVGNIEEKTLASLEPSMPELFAEMRTDLRETPMKREFIITSKHHIYNSGRKKMLAYYYEDHKDLEDKVGVLVNVGAVIDITYNNADRYLMSEALVRYLIMEEA